MKKLIMFVCIGLFSTGAFAQQPAKAKPAPTQEPVKVAPVAKDAAVAPATRVEPAPTTNTTPASSGTSAGAIKKNKLVKVTPRTATAKAVPLNQAKEK